MEELKNQLEVVGYTGDMNLSSLVAFYPSGQISISRIPDAFEGWKATAQDGEKRAKGATAEEAMARLLLILKK